MQKSLTRLGVGLLAALSLAWSTVAVGPAQADTRPPNPSDPKTPVTVAADPLPTVQIDGVAWTQRVIGNTVYVGGKFTTARPAGAAPGTSTTARANLLAYDIRTGALITTWAPTTNGDVLSIVPSPDNTRLYIGGSFTTVNGQTRNRIAALDPATGDLIGSFQPKPDATVRAIAATSDTVYFGGLLSAVGGVARTRVASVRASDGALLSWAPNAQGGSVHSLALSPDRQPADHRRLVHHDERVVQPRLRSGLGQPQHRRAAAVRRQQPDPQRWRERGDHRPVGRRGQPLRLRLRLRQRRQPRGRRPGSTGTAASSSGSRTATATPTAPSPRATSSTCPATRTTAATCRTASRRPTRGPSTTAPPSPRPRPARSAATRWATSTGRATRRPSLLKWIPALTNGTFTGQGQAGWNVTGNADYVTIGGEFPRAGSVAQQGLVRYAVREIAPNDVGPEITGSRFNPNVASWARGTVKVSWPANWDRDNEQLTYSLIRNGDIANPIYTATQLSSEWSRPANGLPRPGPGARRDLPLPGVRQGSLGQRGPLRHGEHRGRGRRRDLPLRRGGDGRRAVPATGGWARARGPRSPTGPGSTTPR